MKLSNIVHNIADLSNMFVVVSFRIFFSLIFFCAILLNDQCLFRYVRFNTQFQHLFANREMRKLFSFWCFLQYEKFQSFQVCRQLKNNKLQLQHYIVMRRWSIYLNCIKFFFSCSNSN